MLDTSPCGGSRRDLFTVVNNFSKESNWQTPVCVLYYNNESANNIRALQPVRQPVPSPRGQRWQMPVLPTHSPNLRRASTARGRL